MLTQPQLPLLLVSRLGGSGARQQLALVLTQAGSFLQLLLPGLGQGLK